MSRSPNCIIISMENRARSEIRWQSALQDGVRILGQGERDIAHHENPMRSLSSSVESRVNQPCNIRGL